MLTTQFISDTWKHCFRLDIQFFRTVETIYRHMGRLSVSLVETISRVTVFLCCHDQIVLYHTVIGNTIVSLSWQPYSVVLNPVQNLEKQPNSYWKRARNPPSKNCYQYLNLMESWWESTWNPPSKGFSDVLDLPIIWATFQKVDSWWIPGGFPKNKH